MSHSEPALTDKKEAGGSLAGRRILVVEDEMLVSMLIEDVLRELGCDIVGPVATREKAIAVAKTEPIDAALLDVNLAGEPVYPVADVLSARRIPFAFVTGYGEAGVDARYARALTLTKPFQLSIVEQVIAQLIGPSRG
jgi:CheY-like chemotaxis protein